MKKGLNCCLIGVFWFVCIINIDNSGNETVYYCHYYGLGSVAAFSNDTELSSSVVATINAKTVPNTIVSDTFILLRVHGTKLLFIIFQRKF